MKYRKKPVIIDAIKWDGKFLTADSFLTCDFEIGDNRSLTIPTLEGDMRADVGDWIIRGVKDEFYPCKPDIFAATYERVDG